MARICRWVGAKRISLAFCGLTLVAVGAGVWALAANGDPWPWAYEIWESGNLPRTLSFAEAKAEVEWMVGQEVNMVGTAGAWGEITSQGTPIDVPLTALGDPPSETIYITYDFYLTLQGPPGGPAVVTRHVSGVPYSLAFVGEFSALYVPPSMPVTAQWGSAATPDPTLSAGLAQAFAAMGETGSCGLVPAVLIRDMVYGGTPWETNPIASWRAGASFLYEFKTPPNQPPAAVIAATPTSGGAPLTVSFNGGASSDPDGTIVDYAWSFGDGGTASGPQASHTYNNPGNYTATLTVTDDRGATGKGVVNLTVVRIDLANIVDADGNLVVTDDQEENPGVPIVLNDDDDDKDGVPDNANSVLEVQENDYVQMTLDVLPLDLGAPTGLEFSVTLEKETIGSGGDIRVFEIAEDGTATALDFSDPASPPRWRLPSLPRVLRIEGLFPSGALKDIRLKATLRGGGVKLREDVVSVTVAKLELQDIVDSQGKTVVTDDKEDEPGVIMSRDGAPVRMTLALSPAGMAAPAPKTMRAQLRKEKTDTGDILVYEEVVGGDPRLLDFSDTADLPSWAIGDLPRTLIVKSLGFSDKVRDIKLKPCWESAPSQACHDVVGFTIVYLNLTAWTSNPVTVVPEEREEDPGACVGMNSDDDDHDGRRDGEQAGPLSSDDNDLVELDVFYSAPEGMDRYTILRVERKAPDHPARIKIWSDRKKTECILDPQDDPYAESEPRLVPNAGMGLLKCFVEGLEMNRHAAPKLVVSARPVTGPVADSVAYTVIGIDAVVDKDRFKNQERLYYVPLVRRAFDLTDDEDVRTRAGDMSFALHIFEPGAKAEAGAQVWSFARDGTQIDWEKGDAPPLPGSSKELDVQRVDGTDDYAGWDNDPPIVGRDLFRGFIVENTPAAKKLANGPDTIRGEAGGTVLVCTTEASDTQGIEDPGFKCAVLGSNLMLKPPGASESDPEVLLLSLPLNNDDDDEDGSPDNLDEVITGTDAQKGADKRDMASLRLAALLPKTRPAGTITLSQESGDGQVRLFRAADETHYWTSGPKARDVGSLTEDEDYLVEGVQPGEIVIRLEYRSGDGLVRWYDRVKILVIGVQIVGIEGWRRTDYEEKPATERWAPRRMYVGNAGPAGNPLPSPPNVLVTAKIYPVPQHGWLYWAHCDPDEPAGGIPNDADTAGGDNRGSLSAQPFSAIAGWAFDGVKSATAIDSTGMTKVMFTSTTYGGDNFNIGAGTRFAGTNDATYRLRDVQSPVLTVWKRIYYEPFRGIMRYKAYDTVFDREFFSSVKNSLAPMYVEPVFTRTQVDYCLDPTRSEFIPGHGGAYGPTPPSAITSLANAYRTSDDTVTVLLVRGEGPGRNMLDDNLVPLHLLPFSPAGWQQYQWTAFYDARDHFDPTEDHSGGVGSTSAPANTAVLYLDELAVEALIQWRMGNTPNSIEWFRRNVLVSLLHETGHLLGVPHQAENVNSSIMWPRTDFSLQGSWRFFNIWVSGATWQSSDGQRVREYYAPLKR